MQKKNKLSLYAIVWIITWGLVHSLTMSIAKSFDASVSTIQIVFYRNLLGCLIIFFIYSYQHGSIQKIRTNNLSLHFIRTVFGCVAMFATYYAYRHLHLANATTIGFTTPFLSVVFSYLFLRERLSFAKVMTILVGYLGVVAMAQPKWTNVGFSLGFGAAIVANIASSLSLVVAKKLSAREDTLTIVSCYQLGSFLFAGLAVVFYSVFIEHSFASFFISSGSFLKIFLIAILAVFSQFCYVKALQHAALSFVAPFEYLRIIYATIIGYHFFAEQVDLYDVIGICLIISSAMFLVKKG